MAASRTPGFPAVGTVPWGRNRAEYTSFFALGAPDSGLRILDIGAGPSSFTAETNESGGRAVAVDPLYADPPAAIAGRIEETRETIMAGLRANAARFVWDVYGDPDGLLEVRRTAMALFLEDFRRDRRGRYVAGALPRLPFADDSFDLVLVSHLLFLYSTGLDAAFHQAAVAETLRLAPEVRIFPLLDMDGMPSSHIQPVRAAARRAGAGAQTRPVPYEFQRGGNRMLVLKRGLDF